MRALLRAEGYLSSAQLCRELSVSRTAVWKAVEALRAEGYEIESKTNLGYRLTDAPDLLTEAEIGEHCALGARQLFILPEVDSTSTYAKRLALEGASEAVVLAESQTGGRGRLGRSFSSPKGRGLYLSILTRPPLETAECALITACVGVAVCDAIEQVCGRRPAIKWTNDLQFDGKKLCGILTELTTEGESGRVLSLVMGIGINVAQSEAEFGELAEIATSIRLATGREVRRAVLAAAVIREVERMTEALAGGGVDDYLTRYRSDCSTVGKRVTVIGPREKREALALDVTERAELVVRYDDGTEEALSSGEVSVRPV